MNKDEILAKSRAENGNRDMYEQEVLKQSKDSVVLVQTVMAAIFFVIQLVVGGGVNWGLWAIVLSTTATTFWVKYRKLHRRHELVIAIIYTLVVLTMAACHIYTLIASSAIL